MNVYDALSDLENIEEFCRKGLAIGTGLADRGVLKCQELREVLLEGAVNAAHRSKVIVMPSKVTYD